MRIDFALNIIESYLLKRFEQAAPYIDPVHELKVVPRPNGAIVAKIVSGNDVIVEGQSVSTAGALSDLASKIGRLP